MERAVYEGRKAQRLKTLSDRCLESKENHPDCENETEEILSITCEPLDTNA